MNKENVLKLADHIENLKAEDESYEGRKQAFNMNFYEFKNGMPAALVSHVVWLDSGDKDKPYSRLDRPWANFYDIAGRWLGIHFSHQEIEQLLDPEDKESITPTHAASVLRNYAETGSVDWSVK